MSRPLLRVRNVTRDRLVAGRVASAGTFWSSFRGLMRHPGLEPEEGLWLPGVNNIHMFFMRFPIDAVFLSAPDGEGARTVTHLYPSLPPWRGVVWFARGAKGVLELAAGAAARSGTNVGDRLTLLGEDGRPV